MIHTEPQFVTDAAGERVAVLLPIAEYQRLLDILDDADARQAYDAAKASGDDALPFDDIVRELDARQGG